MKARVDLALEGADQGLPALEWQRDDDALVAEGATGEVAATVRIGAELSGVRVKISLRYEVDAKVIREAVAFRIEGGARAIGRDLGFTRLTSALRIDRGTPSQVAVAPDDGPGVVVVPDAGVVGMRVEPSERDTEVVVILDDEAAHPFAVRSKCVRSWVKGEEPPLVAHARTTRRKGDVVSAEVMLYLLEARQEFVPLVVERWSSGARAAVVFSDHADRTDADGLRAVLYGTSDEKSPDYGKGGFVGNKLRMSRTFFARKGEGTLDDPKTQLLADELVATGSDVGSHSISEKPDARQDVAKHLPVYARWHASTWIDHQPDTNCEAVSNQGWEDEGAYGVRDLLVQQGFRWIWQGTDSSSTSELANLFRPGRADDPAPPFYPLPDDPRLRVFGSSWFYDTAAKLASALDESALDRLERERGLFIGHTYLSPTTRTTRAKALNRRNLVSVRNGIANLDAGFDAALGRLGKRVASGSLASLTVPEAGARLEALEKVVVRYRVDGSAFVANFGPAPITGLTIAVPVATEVAIQGATIGGSRQEGDRTTFWFDLPVAGVVVVRSAKTPFLAGGPITVEGAP